VTAFPDDFFTPMGPRPPGWRDTPELRALLDWFRSFMSAEEWKSRRNAACDRLYDAASGKVVDEGGRFFDSEDKIGWYLLLADAFLDHVHNYEPMYGSRVVPILIALGRDLELLKTVVGVEPRVQRLLLTEKAQPNGGLFELLVAVAYRRAGAQVAFVPEQPGARTHDLDVTLDGRSWAVECKRMETAEYGARERELVRQLWGPCIAGLSREGPNGEGRSAICTAHFKVPVEEVPKNYFIRVVRGWVASGQPNLLWEDEVAWGSVGEPDLGPLQAALADDDVLTAGTRMQELLCGRHARNQNFSQVLRAKAGDNPRYTTACDLAIVLRWETLAEGSIDAKARDVFRKMVEASRQLPDDRPGIVHVGFEAVEGDEVERRRHAKIIANAAKFDPQGKPLEWLYCHYFVPESPPLHMFEFDETIQWCGIRPTAPRPVEKLFLVVENDETFREGPHWQGPALDPSPSLMSPG